MKKYEVVIIGAGASGCMCALQAKSKSVAVLDAGKGLAKKIMVTGNGRCNLTNKHMNSSYFNQNIDSFLQKFDQEQTLKFFESLGLVCFSDEEGRVYPISNSAKSVVDVINNALKSKVDSYLEHVVTNIEHNGTTFKVTTKGEVFECKKLVIASGGNSLHENIEGLGVKSKKNCPSLVALKTQSTKELDGVKVSNVKVTARTSKGTKQSEYGEVLFKDCGLSGIVVFNLSALFAREQKFEGCVDIDLLPNLSEKQVVDLLNSRCVRSMNADKLFVGMFANAVANQIFMQSKVNTNRSTCDLDNLDFAKLAKAIKCLHFEVCGRYENNQVFSGGVDLGELDQKLMSKKIKNLYFCGEVCDVDGVCGGYNLQWAWTSGKIVGDCL